MPDKAYARDALHFQPLYTDSKLNMMGGSQVTSALGLSPPTVHDYLYSCNNNLLVHHPNDDMGEEFEGADNDFYL